MRRASSVKCEQYLVRASLPVSLLYDLPPDIMEVGELLGLAVEELGPLLAGVVVQLQH